MKFTAISGFFVQDNPAANPLSVGATPARFGLIDASPNRWVKFTEAIRDLNEKADSDTSYKVFFFGRHGQGYHNVAEAKYGTQAWDDYWSKLNGDDEMVWGPDPQLTTLGELQAQEAHNLWKTEVPANLPLPEKMYCSPLTRAIRTNVITFQGVLASDHPKTIIVENCREENGVHTCDKRNTRSWIQTTFPEFDIESNLTEEDKMWSPTERESHAQVARRAELVLKSIFSKDNETWQGKVISIVAHGGIINGFLTATGRPRYALPTGGILPVVVKCVKAGQSHEEL